MRKERSGLMQVLAVAGAYTAYHIGSGFATGNEIAQFFVSWGGVWPFIVCALVACLGLRKLVDVLGCIGIIIMVFTVSCGIYMILTADVSPLEGAKNTAQYVAEGKILQPTVLGIKNPILAGLSYGGVLMLALPWVTSMGSLLKSKKQAAATSVLSALFLFAAAFSVALALMLNLDDVAGSQIPMLAAVQAHLPFLAGFYSIVIILGIFTTATGQLFILADRFSQQGTKKFYAEISGPPFWCVFSPPGIFCRYAPTGILPAAQFNTMAFTASIRSTAWLRGTVPICSPSTSAMQLSPSAR